MARQPVVRVVVDASVLVAIAFNEESAEQLEARLAGATVHAPMLLKYELAQAAVTKARRDKTRASEFMRMLAAALDGRRRIRWHEVNPTDVALLASVTGLSAYDAAYMWLAGSLGAELVTLDKKLAAATGFEVESIPQ